MTHTPSTDDVIVAGGGPAGATAARLLANWGHRVRLLSRPSVRHSLAESIPPSGVHVLGRIGLRDRVLAAPVVRATGNTVWWGTANDLPRIESFPSGSFGLQVQRSIFDRVLREAATDAGVLVLEGASAREVTETGRSGSAASERLVSFELAGEVQARACSWVLDCTGRSRALSRDLPVSDVGPRTTALVGIWQKETWTLPDWTHTTVESGTDGWAWSIPVSPSTRYFTVMLDPALTSVRRGDALNEIYAGALARFPHHAALTAGASLVASSFAVDATAYRSDRVAEVGALVVGDAASFVDPLASFGVKKAMASAWLAAVVVHTALTESTMTQAAIDLFHRWERSSQVALARGVAEFARVAAGGATVTSDAASSTYWQQRFDEQADEPEGHLDIRTMRTDPHVLRALAELRARERLSIRIGASCNLVPTATVKENRVVLEDHLKTPLLSFPVRYIRNIDLVHLAQIAVGHSTVPDIMDDYNRRYAPAGLPDLLGALAVLIGKGGLEIA